MGISKPKDMERVKKPKIKKKKEKKEPPKKKKMIEGIRGIVRLAEVDIMGDRKIRNALLKVKGIGKSLANSIPIAAGLDPNIMIGSLNDQELERLESVIKEPSKFGIPTHMLNRKKEPLTGEDKHLTASELTFAVKSNIDFMKKIRSYKGVRHSYGLPVRGQRTRSSFRRGMIVGVSKKELKARKEKKKAAKEVEEVPKEEKPEEKKEVKKKRPEEKKE